MILRVFLASFFIFTACSHRLPRKSAEPAYRLVPELPEDLKKLEKAADRSRAEMEIDFETGHFKGRYLKHEFTGSYAIKHVSAGFVKGFFYRISLDSLNRPEHRNAEEEAFFGKLAEAKRLYVAPDKPGDPAYTVLEISNGEPEGKLTFVKINLRD
ncbi:MAG: hypothetical protein KF870_17220 [Leadbetterella sp.]|nr:hypothetical protein [Leadbetterella sp.]